MSTIKFMIETPDLLCDDHQMNGLLHLHSWSVSSLSPTYKLLLHQLNWYQHLCFLPPNTHTALIFHLWELAPYLRQPAVLVSAVSHSRCLGLQFSSPPPAPLLPRSQPEWGTITSSARACRAWSTISIFTESWDERFHSVPGEEE